MSDFYCDQVLSGRTAVDIVHETDAVLAFHHTRPAYPVHVVVVPKRHIASLLELDDDVLALDLLFMVRAVAAGVLAERGAARVITNVGEYQDSKHLHWHVVSGERLT